MNRIEAFLGISGLTFFYTKLFVSLVISFLITYLAIPSIIKISKRKNLIDSPGERSSHMTKIPNLGGIAIFYSIGICASIFAAELFDLYKFLFASLIILLYVFLI